METEERSIWKNLAFALAGIPAVFFIGFIVIALFEALGYGITRLQKVGFPWLLFVIAYVISLIYFIYEPKIRKNIERKKVVNALILYWEVQLAKQGKKQPSEGDIELMEEMFMERVKIWAWFSPELWAECFPDEKYSKYPFGIVDNMMEKWLTGWSSKKDNSR